MSAKRERSLGRRPILGAAVGLLLALPAAAWGQGLPSLHSGGDQRESVAITVYNQNFGLVREVREEPRPISTSGWSDIGMKYQFHADLPEYRTEDSGDGSRTKIRVDLDQWPESCGRRRIWCGSDS